MNPHGNLSRFGAYAKALQLFDLVIADLAPLCSRPELSRLVAQQIASADSIAANIEEGYGRGGPKEYCHFLVIARGSAQETAGRYRRLHHWLTAESIRGRVALCAEITAILTATINTLRQSRID